MVVSGIATTSSEAKITITRVADRPGISATLFGRVADANIVVDMIVQNMSQDGSTDISFTVPRTDYARCAGHSCVPWRKRSGRAR